MIPGRREWREPAQKPVERFDGIKNTLKAPVQMIESWHGNQQVQRFPLFQDKTIAKTAPEMSKSMVVYVKFRAANNRSSCPSESPERHRRPSFHQVNRCLQRIEGPQQDDDKPRARPQYPRCECTQPVDVRDAIQRTKVGVEPIEASRGKGKRRIVAHPALDEIRNSDSLRFLDDSVGHLSRKIDARNVDTAASQVDRIVSGSAPQIDNFRARAQNNHPVPSMYAHAVPCPAAYHRTADRSRRSDGRTPPEPSRYGFWIRPRARPGSDCVVIGEYSGRVIRQPPRSGASPPRRSDRRPR